MQLSYSFGGVLPIVVLTVSIMAGLRLMREESYGLQAAAEKYAINVRAETKHVRLVYSPQGKAFRKIGDVAHIETQYACFRPGGESRNRSIG